jgi:AcrR family transcriptional regulator
MTGYTCLEYGSGGTPGPTTASIHMKEYLRKDTGTRRMEHPVPEKIKQRLYPVVLDLFSRRDFHQVNLRDISHQTGISTGTIYKYFSSKEDLLFTILDEKMSELPELFAAHIEGLEDTVEIFRKIIWVSMDFYERNPAVAITAFITVPTRTWMQEHSYRREDVKTILRRLVERGKGRADIDPSVTPRIIEMMYYMLCYRHIHAWYYHGMKWKLTENIDEIFNLLWKAVRREN